MAVAEVSERNEIKRRLATVEMAVNALMTTVDVQRAATMLIGTVATTLSWALRTKGLLTTAELAAAEQEMKASAEVDRALDPKLREINDALQALRAFLDRLGGGDQTPPSRPHRTKGRKGRR